MISVDTDHKSSECQSTVQFLHGKFSMATFFAARSPHVKTQRQILDDVGQPIFTTLFHPQRFGKDMTVIYRGDYTRNNVLAILKGNEVVRGELAEKQRDLFTDKKSWRACQSFPSELGVLTWQTTENGYQAR